jgi:four helix bundle protein
MQSPTRLRVFHEAEELAVSVYSVTRALPHEERYGLVQQMRRAGVSIASNIAEGCGRGGNRELTRFLSIALGSATELECQLRLARRLEYIDREIYEEVSEHAPCAAYADKPHRNTAAGARSFPRPAVNRQTVNR